MFHSLSTAEIAALIIIALLFLGASYGSERIAAGLHEYLDKEGLAGMTLYTSIVALIVLIPFASTLPLIPVAVELWGSPMTALLSWLGWMISATIIILATRHFGFQFVRRIGLLDRVREFGHALPHKDLRWGALFLGMVGAPIDVVSYAMGLFTAIPVTAYLSAVALGLIPFALFIAYTATLPIINQAYIMGFVIIFWGAAYSHLKSRSQSGG
ncbi:MAG: VTT domain-containing protein [Patescibacteria group bacterium]